MRGPGAGGAQDPFARFMCSGFWPSENRLYQQDKEAYFQRLDAVVRAAEKHGIGLIPRSSGT